MAGHMTFSIQPLHCINGLSPCTLYQRLVHDLGMKKNCKIEIEVCVITEAICIGYTPRAKLLSDLATECCRHKDA